jgi:hypothetical protein
MNEVDELFTAMLAIVFAAVILVGGGLYIDNKPMQPLTVPAEQIASMPINPQRSDQRLAGFKSAAATPAMRAIDRFGKRYATAALL